MRASAAWQRRANRKLSVGDGNRRQGELLTEAFQLGIGAVEEGGVGRALASDVLQTGDGVVLGTFQ